jgi:formylglycine-generating enzyme required for sulfatase activity
MRREGRTCRLPTEAEWEYACRAGSEARYWNGDDPSKLSEAAWLADNAAGNPQPVGRKLPNPFGLFDVHGNVWEYCSDWFAFDTYQHSRESDPQGPSEGSDRTMRGGGAGDPVIRCRSAIRQSCLPDYPTHAAGWTSFAQDFARELIPCG